MLGLKAARAALDDAGLEARDIDLIVCATSTPDYTFPSTATMIQCGLGMTHGAAFDLQAVCTGFVYAVATADKFLLSGSRSEEHTSELQSRQYIVCRLLLEKNN